MDAIPLFIAVVKYKYWLPKRPSKLGGSSRGSRLFQPGLERLEPARLVPRPSLGHIAWPVEYTVKFLTAMEMTTFYNMVASQNHSTAW